MFDSGHDHLMNHLTPRSSSDEDLLMNLSFSLCRLFEVLCSSLWLLAAVEYPFDIHLSSTMMSPIQSVDEFLGGNDREDYRRRDRMNRQVCCSMKTENGIRHRSSSRIDPSCLSNCPSCSPGGSAASSVTLIVRPKV